jgi:hypothetical protein
MTRDQIADLESHCGALPPDYRPLVEFGCGVSLDDVSVGFRRDPPSSKACFGAVF